MSRQPKNDAFARTSFLQGANAAYIEEMQAQYERNPGSVSDEWRHFFASLQEEHGDGRGQTATHGPSWARPLEQVRRQQRAAGRADRRLRRRRAPACARSCRPARAAGRLRAVAGGLAARHPGQHPRPDADPRLSRHGPPRRRPRSAGPHRAQDPQGAAARDLRLHGSRPRPPDLHRQGAGPRDRHRARDPEDPAPHLLPPDRRRVHAHHLAGAEVLDPGAHRGPRQGHHLHGRRQARDPQQADRGGDLREVRRRQVHRHQALRPRRRRGDGAGARADHQARRPARREGDRHRHGAPRAPQRAGQRHGQAAPRHLQRVQGRLLQARRRRRLGRREVPPRRLLGPRVRRQQRAPVADRQPLASRDRRSGGARQGARQAGPARLQAGRAHAGAAAADPRRCGVRRPGRGGRVLRPVGPQGPPHRRLDPLHHQQPDRLHDQPALLALLALLLGRRQDGRGADLPRERRQPGSGGARRQDRHRVPAEVPEAGGDRHVLLPPLRPQRVRRAGVHAAADVSRHQGASVGGRDLLQAADRGRRHHQARTSRRCRAASARTSTPSSPPPKATSPTRPTGSTAAGPTSASPTTRRGAATPACRSRR